MSAPAASSDTAISSYPWNAAQRSPPISYFVGHLGVHVRTLGRYGIRVNALVPGAVAAGGFVADPKLAKHIPLGRLGAAEDLAPMALAVLSNKVSAYVTGASIVVDGGLSLTNWFEPPELGDL